MKDATNPELYKELLRVMARMQNDVDYRRSLNDYLIGVSGRIRKQRPAISVGAECNGAIDIGHQHVTARKELLHVKVFDELIHNYGKLNVLDAVSNNHVGHCAENYAATGVLNQLEDTNNVPHSLSEIGFTDAFCARTGMMKDWCAICHKIFD